MNRCTAGFHNANDEFVTADTRVEHRCGERRGTVNAIFQEGEAEALISIWSNGIRSGSCCLGVEEI